MKTIHENTDVFIILAWKRVRFSGMEEVRIKRQWRKLNKIKGLPIYTPSSCPHFPELRGTSVPHKHPVSTSPTGRVTSSWIRRMTSSTCAIPFGLSPFNLQLWTVTQSVSSFARRLFFFLLSSYNSTNLVCECPNVYKHFLKFICYAFW